MKTTFLFLFVLLGVAWGAPDPSKIKQKATQLDLADLRWIESERIVIRTTNSKVYLSTDGGMNWVDQTPKMPGCGQNGNFPAFLYPHAVDKTKIYVRGNGTISWRSFDKGDTWSTVDPDRRYINLRWHPTKWDYALAQAGSSLYVTQNFGSSWGLVSDNIEDGQYDWGDAGVGDVPVNTIYFVQTSGSTSSLKYTEDFGTTAITLAPFSFQFLFMNKQLFVASYSPSNGDYYLQVTPHLGVPATYKKFYVAEFPFGESLSNRAYVLLDDHTGAVFMAIVHGRPGSSFQDSNLYVSDAAGYRYITSLQHISQTSFLYDFERIRGLDGIFLANTVENWEDPNPDIKKQTFFSFNNGGEWLEVNPPHFDSEGRPITCPTGQRCKLNLHGWGSLATGPFGPFYSSHYAVGLILATGNVGEYLTLEQEQTNTYLSDDAGITWREIRKGSSIYEFGDHGGIMVLADFAKETNKLYYSLDEAHTLPLPYITLDYGNVYIYNIVAEPSSTGEKFIVYGDGVVIGVDFSQVFDRVCEDKDYYLWSPSDDRSDLHGNPCLLGRTVTYRRRNATSECFNNEDVERVGQVIPCACVREDYECDFDFMLNDKMECIPIPGKNPVYPPEYCPSGATYSKTRGYRLIANDSCEGGLDLKPTGNYDCPSITAEQAKRGWIAVAVLLPLVCCCLIIAVVAARSGRIQERLPFLRMFGTWKSGYLTAQHPDTLIDDEDEFTVGTHPESSSDPFHSEKKQSSEGAEKKEANQEEIFDPRA